jgi:hypothetical protein
VRVGEHLFLLHHRVPQLRVAHEGDAEDLFVFVEELVLAQHSEPQRLGDRHRAGGRRRVPAENAQERGLATPVGAHDAVALARVELKSRIGEENPLAEHLG